MSSKTENKKVTSGTTMGVTSIIAILVILVLIVFAALSVTTSKADKRLSEKMAVSVTAYYEADTKAEELTANIADLFSSYLSEPEAKDFKSWASTETEYVITEKPDGIHVTFTVPIDEGRNLDVELLIASDGTVTKKLWQVVTSGDWENDDDLNVVQEF
jgi:hypothetical protein